jgi:adenine C2-methylase RlmN of 23S rRNA A2503 and tRNA A37
MVNLIVFNPHEGTHFERSNDEQVGWVGGVEVHEV